MAEPKPFIPVKLICGIIAPREPIICRAVERLVFMYGPADSRSPLFTFHFTDYYEKQMGTNLKRMFLSFQRLIEPARLSEIKHQTNCLERDTVRKIFGGSHDQSSCR
jgi:hypothetical protein